MDTDNVMLDLCRRFAAPLPEYYHRRVIFWQDEEREFDGRVEELVPENVRLLRLDRGNAFAVKRALHEDAHSSFLVYCPLRYETLEDDWLLDARLYSEAFRADLVSIWMEEMGLPAQPALRRLVKGYNKFFAARERRAKVAALLKGAEAEKPSQLHLAVMAALCCAKNARPAAILRAVLRGLGEGENAAWAAIERFGAAEAFWKLAQQASGYADKAPELSELARHILLTACTRTMKEEALSGLERYISRPHQAWCFDFISEWLHSDESEQLRIVAREVEESLRLRERFLALGVEALLETECFPCVHECILERLLSDASQRIADPAAIDAAVEKRRTCAWYAEVAPFYEGLSQVAAMQRFYTEHAAGFHTVEPQAIFRDYANDLYRMDGAYRRFHLCYARSLNACIEPLSDLFARVADTVEGLYENWFLRALGERWTAAIEEPLGEEGRIPGVPRQEDFYRDHVAGRESSIVVIISDALRYEVAVALAERLRQETQSKVELTAMQGIFPTETRFGMAALLPHKALSVAARENGRVAVLADGLPTDSAGREKVLKAAEPRSVALQYRDVVSMTTEQLRARTTGMEVVYIYHDAIDSAGHADDARVFPACEEAIAELQGLVRIVANRMNRHHVLITADHGFLYTYSPLRESDKVERRTFADAEVECGRRFAILRAGATCPSLMPVRFIGDGAGFAAFAPRENIRIRMQGGGLNYVHGGVSLQEMCVPVLSWRHMRSDSREYQRHRGRYQPQPVTVQLLSSARKVSNMIFNLNFYQREAVGDNRTAQTYLLRFTDAEGNAVSDTQTLIADKTSLSDAERTFRLTFNLKQRKYSATETYYLVIQDAQGLSLPQKEEFHIDIAFAVDEFDFFS